MSEERREKFPGVVPRLVILALRVALVAGLFGAGWLVYSELPATSSPAQDLRTTNVQIVLRQPDNGGPTLNLPVSLYPVDVAI